MFIVNNDSWHIRKTKEKGLGAFAKKNVDAGTIIGDYLGKIIHITQYDPDYDKNGLYLMYFSDDAFIYPNLKKPGIHLLNHSCQPNCWIYMYRGHTLVFTLRDIEPGEEFTISYLLNPKDETCIPCTHICKCMSTCCTGTMHLTQDKYETWQIFQHEQKKKTRRIKVPFGKNLPRLTSYPKINPDNPIYLAMCSA